MNEWLDVEGDREISALVSGHSVPGMFLATVHRHGDQPAFSWRTVDGTKSWSWNDYAGWAVHRAGNSAESRKGHSDRNLASGFHQVGLRHGNRRGISFGHTSLGAARYGICVGFPYPAILGYCYWQL